MRFRDPAGVQRSKTFDLKRDARRFVNEVEADMARGQYLDASLGRTTLGEYAGTWLEIQTFKATSRQSTEQRLRSHILPTLGAVPLGHLRPTQIQALIKAKQATLAPSTIHQVIATLSAVLNAAQADGYIRSNPATSSSIKLPKKSTEKIVPWTDREVMGISAALPDRYAFMLALGVGLGLRQGEAFGLAIDDIDFLRSTVTVRRQVCIVHNKLVFSAPKNGKVRSVPLPAAVARQVNAHAAAWEPRLTGLPWDEPGGDIHDARLLLVSREGKALNRNYINSSVWRPARARTGLRDVRANGFHGARHYYASKLLEGGTSIRALSEYLGHSDPGFTLRTYTHLMPEAGDKTKRVVDDVFERLESIADDPARGPDVAQGGR